MNFCRLKTESLSIKSLKELIVPYFPYRALVFPKVDWEADPSIIRFLSWGTGSKVTFEEQTPSVPSRWGSKHFLGRTWLMTHTFSSGMYTVCLHYSLSFLSSWTPNWWRQMVTLPEFGSTGGFFFCGSVNQFFSSPLSPLLRMWEVLKKQIYVMVMRQTDRGGSNLPVHTVAKCNEGGKVMEKMEGKRWTGEVGSAMILLGRGGCLGEKQQHVYCWRPWLATLESSLFPRFCSTNKRIHTQHHAPARSGDVINYHQNEHDSKQVCVCLPARLCVCVSERGWCREWERKRPLSVLK